MGIGGPIDEDLWPELSKFRGRNTLLGSAWRFLSRSIEEDMPVPHDVSKIEWKIWREVHRAALERFCEAALSEIMQVCLDTTRSPHERYRDVFRRIHLRDDEIARSFDTPQRSTMFGQLAGLHMSGLLEPEELRRFSPELRAQVERLAEAIRTRR